MGVKISFVKSLTFDEWTERNMLFMENGGNAAALAYFKKQGCFTKKSGIDYQSGYIQEYK